MTEARDQLAAGVEALGLELPDTAIQKLVDYLEHLARWNRVHNLTAVREVSQMVPRHLLDSLAVLPHVNGTRLIDVGSGAGLPGVPLAIAAQVWQLLNALMGRGWGTRDTACLLEVLENPPS